MGRKVDELIVAIKNIAGKDVEGVTVGDVLENLNKQYEIVELTINVVDGAGDPIATPTVTLKTGSTLGSGTEVSASGGTYDVTYGPYNVTVVKATYTTVQQAISIDFDDVEAGTKTVTVTLTLT